MLTRKGRLKLSLVSKMTASTAEETWGKSEKEDEERAHPLVRLGVIRLIAQYYTKLCGPQKRVD